MFRSQDSRRRVLKIQSKKGHGKYGNHNFKFLCTPNSGWGVRGCQIGVEGRKVSVIKMLMQLKAKQGKPFFKFSCRISHSLHHAHMPCELQGFLITLFAELFWV